MHRTAILALAGLLFLAQGCDRPLIYRNDSGQQLPAPTGGPLVPEAGSPVPDVPLPEGFVIATDQSRSTVMNGARFVDHYYQGRARFDLLLDYYRQQLAKNQWDKAGEEIGGNSAVLRYLKGRESLELHISKPDRVVTIHLLIQAATGLSRPVAP